MGVSFPMRILKPFIASYCLAKTNPRVGADSEAKSWININQITGGNCFAWLISFGCHVSSCSTPKKQDRSLWEPFHLDVPGLSCVEEVVALLSHPSGAIIKKSLHKGPSRWSLMAIWWKQENLDSYDSQKCINDHRGRELGEKGLLIVCFTWSYTSCAPQAVHITKQLPKLTKWQNQN